MTDRVINIRKLDFIDYEIEVEHSARSWFGLGPVQTWRQIYRGCHVWKLYPQGTRLGVFGREWTLGHWLDDYVQQYEWSQEYQGAAP